MGKRKLTHRQLRLRKATNIAASLIHSGAARGNLERFSTRTLEAALGKERIKTSRALAISDVLAARGGGRKPKKVR